MTTQYNRKFLIAAFALPLLALMVMAGLQVWQRHRGVEVVLPIEGYDPRNLLSGHYVTYRIVYDATQQPCLSQQTSPTMMCLNDDSGSWVGSLIESSQPSISLCKVTIKGHCRHGRFVAGIERFFIPEQHANALDKAVRDKEGELVLSVRNGKAVIKDLRIQGKSWRTFVQE